MLGLLALLLLCGGARAATADAAGDCAARILDVRIAQALPDGARPADGPAWHGHAARRLERALARPYRQGLVPDRLAL
ncbi:hypothetical protein WJ970_12355 [Achromobacter xylosoxidans]